MFGWSIYCDIAIVTQQLTLWHMQRPHIIGPLMKIFIECDDSSYRPSHHRPSCFRKQTITAKSTKLWHKVVRLFAMFSFEIHTKVMKQNKSLWPFLWHNSLNRNIDLDDGDDKCFDVPSCLKMSICYIFLRKMKDAINVVYLDQIRQWNTSQ